MKPDKYILTPIVLIESGKQTMYISTLIYRYVMCYHGGIKILHITDETNSGLNLYVSVVACDDYGNCLLLNIIMLLKTSRFYLILLGSCY